MKTLLINFPLRPESNKRIFPVGLGYIATAIQQAGFDFELCDLDTNRTIDLDTKLAEGWDVVCLGSLVTGYRMVKQIIGQAKLHNPNCKVIVGNSVATSIPDLLLAKTQADVAVMLEGDRTIVELLETVRTGKSFDSVNGIYCRGGTHGVIVTPARELIADVSSLPFIDFDLFDVQEYISSSRYQVNDASVVKGEVRALPISTARGCINNCTFCYHVFKGKKYRYRTAQSIVADVRRLIERYSLNYIQFWDELTFFSKKQAAELADEILASGLKFAWMARCRANLFDREEDLDVIQKMKDAGCCGVQFSLESSDPVILKEMRKNITPDQFSYQSGLFRKAGLAAWTSLVFGYPQETPQTIRSTIECCIQNGLYPSSGFLLPQPGSPMYEYAKSRGLIGDEEEFISSMGDRQDLTINLTGMSNQEFESCVNFELERASKALGVNLGKDGLIKTQHAVKTEGSK